MDSAWPYLVDDLGLLPGSGESCSSSSSDAGSDCGGSDNEDQCPQQANLAYPGTTVIAGVLVALDADGDVIMADGASLVHDDDVEVEGECDHKPGDVGKEELGGGRVEGREVSIGVASGDGQRDEIDQRPSGGFESEEDTGPYQVKE